jgi:tetratricopeptide (TPR) repeat protein
MRRLLSVIPAGLLPSVALLAQIPNPGMTTQQTRLLTAVTEMGHTSVGSATPAESLTFEQGDDPTVAAHAAPPHEPTKAARKAAEKGERLAKKQKPEEAIAAYRESVALDPLYFEAWNNLALELSAAGQTDEAEKVFRRLMQSNPEHVAAFTNLAALLTSQKRYADAEAVARQAMKQHSYSFKANLVLATVLINEGRWSPEAKTKLEYAQVKYPQAKALLDRWPPSPPQ